MVQQILYRCPADYQSSRWKDSFCRIPEYATRDITDCAKHNFDIICTGEFKQVVAFRKVLRERYGNKNPPPVEQLKFMWEVFKAEQDEQSNPQVHTGAV